jgi:hypothetical protein
MTDPLEDRLRAHFADRAAQVAVAPDPAAIVERSTRRPRVGAPLVAVLAAAVALLTGGSFLTGMSVAGSSPATTPVPPAVHGAASPQSNGTFAPAPSTTVIGGSATAVAPPLTSLFTRTTSAGVTIRAYTSTSAPTTGCTLASACPPTPGCTSSPCPPTGVVPVPCPANAACAQPISMPMQTAGATGGAPGDSGAGAGGAVSGSVPPATGVGGAPVSTTTTVPQQATSCQQLTLELSTDRAVWSASIGGPTSAVLGPKSVQILATGSFGEAEGGPVGWVAVLVSGEVASVRLVSSTGAVLDVMTPSTGVVVLAATGATALADTSAVGLDAGGTPVATVPTAQSGSAGAPGCTATPPGPPVPTPTTLPDSTTTTLPVPSTVPQTLPIGSPTTTGPTTSSPVVVPRLLIPSGPATRSP